MENSGARGLFEYSPHHILLRGHECPIYVVLIYPLLAAGLVFSVGYAGSVDRLAEAIADQVAAAGRVMRLRSPGDQTTSFRKAGGFTERPPSHGLVECMRTRHTTEFGPEQCFIALGQKSGLVV